MFTLYRAVDESERKDIERRNGFRPGPYSMEAKLFWTTRRSAERFVAGLRLLESIEMVPQYIVEALVDVSESDRIPVSRMDSMEARSVDLDDLAWFNGSIVNIEISKVVP